jgi:hypothetical protein
MFPYSVYWWQPLWDYKLTGASLAATVGVALHYLYRRRRQPSLQAFNTYSRCLAFYWPVYAWGLDSLSTFWEAQFGGCGPGPRTAVEIINWTMLGWGTIVGTAAILCTVVLFGASLQFAFIRLLPAARGGAVGIPLSVFAVGLGVLGLELSLLVLVLSYGGSEPR